ncbi:SAM-dependent methyltransferase [Streptomyces sp. MAR4 CNX-425]|uniref:SAM-dependent methyltransferase n=1 Tax=Streptomyces sp. MAR4 CNX-425 TaxID=3406343 RepID=UPI003B5040E2
MTTDNGETAWLSTAGGTSWAPPEIDFTKPQTARMYDYYLGGKDHYGPDRETAERVIGVWPSVGKFARANRHFMHLAVERLARAGVDQFLDVGTGIPTSPNVHEVAQSIRPAARILYTDHDPVVLAHARALMNSTDEGRIDYIQGDLRRPETILGHPCMTGPDPALDLARPVAVNLVAIMHFITPADDPKRIVSALLDPLPAGSHLILSHITDEFAPEEVAAAARLYHNQGLPAQARDAAELAELVDALGLELLPPGILPVNRWSPDTPDDRPASLYTDAEASCLGLIARKA